MAARNPFQKPLVQIVQQVAVWNIWAQQMAILGNTKDVPKPVLALLLTKPHMSPW